MSKEDWFESEDDKLDELLDVEKERLELERERLQLERERTEIGREEIREQRVARTFTVLQRERAITEEQRRRNAALIAAGGLMLGAALYLFSKDTSVLQAIEHGAEILSTTNSWGEFLKYFVDVGLVPTALVGAATGMLRSVLRHHEQYTDAVHEREDDDQAQRIVDQGNGPINWEDPQEEQQEGQVGFEGLGGNGHANAR